MSSVEQLLRRWRDAGLLDEATCNRLAEFERHNQKVRSAQPVLVELFAYLGIAIVSAGVVVLVAVNWELLAAWARIAVLGVPGVAMLPIGRLLATGGDAGLRRGGAMGWLLSVAMLAGSVGVAGYEAGWDPETATFAAGGLALPLAAALWALNPAHIQVLGLAAAATLFSIGLAAFSSAYLSDDNTAALGGAAMVVLFTTGAALVRLRILRPEATAGTLSLLGLAFGAGQFSIGLAGRLDEFQVAIAFGGALMAFSLGGAIGTRTGLLIPRPLAGTLSQLGFAIASLLVAVGVAGEAAPEDDAAATFGVILIGFAAALAALAESGVLTPRLTARPLGCAGLVAGSLAASLPDGPVVAEGIPLLVGAGLIALSLNRSTFVYMAGGIAAMFIGFVMPVVRHVDDPTVAALLMIGIGLVLLAVLALLTRYRPWSRAGRDWRRAFVGRHPPTAPA